MKLYPFAAVVGSEEVREALLLNLIDPGIGGVLIDGPAGCGKSTIARSIKDLTNRQFIELPVHVSQERLLGAPDLEKTLSAGQWTLMPGILSSVQDAVLYADQAAQLSEEAMTLILTALSGGTLQPRGAAAFRPDTRRTVFIACINTQQENLRAAAADHFGLYAVMEPQADVCGRMEVLKRRQAYDEDPKAFCEAYQREQDEIREKIEEAQERLADVLISEEDLKEISELCLRANVQGHRADLVLQRTARALAAWRGKTCVTEEEIEKAASFVLPHRMRPSEMPQEVSEEHQAEEQQEGPESEENRAEQKDAPVQSRSSGASGEGSAEKKTGTEDLQKVFGIGETFTVRDLCHRPDRKQRSSSGKRVQTKTIRPAGQYLYPTPVRRNDDIAIDATIRAAAPFQRSRGKTQLAINIQKEDIREKVRQHRTASLLTFVVDASGSMGAMRRMEAAKGAVLSFLADAYVKRDQVTMISFRGDAARVILPPTRSPERGYRLLREMKTGGKTPLNAGLAKALQVIRHQMQKDPDLLPMLILLTDGRGNVPLKAGDRPADELEKIAEGFRKHREIETMVIDIEEGGMLRFGLAKKLAETMQASYYKPDDLKAESIRKIVERNQVQ